MLMGVEKYLKICGVVLGAAAMSGCLATTPRSGGGSSYAEASGYSEVAGGGPVGIRVARVDANSSARACVNDLAFYEAYLQNPSEPAMDINKSVRSYIQDAGDAQTAMVEVDRHLSALNVALDNEMDNRDPFNLRARARSDDAIASIEDGILLNEALAEAISCHLD